MEISKNEIISGICYTELVYGRINKKLKTCMTKNEIEDFILAVLKNTPENQYLKKGKNYYVTNTEKKVRITINSYTLRVITVDSVA